LNSLKAVQSLEAAGIDYRLIELESRAYTVSDVVKYSRGDLKIEEICKTIIMKDSDGFYGVLLLGKERINFKKLKEFRGLKPRIANSGEVSDVAGVEPGAVCPLLINVPLIVDPEVFRMQRINFGSGHHLYGLEMDPGDLSLIVDYSVVKVS
jgi:prolyl-tRNA editing enzyme YbaK/EbsC (Cys-tRNA(Pro) deacylase)